MSAFLTTRQIADEINDNPLVEGDVREWKIRRIFEDGDLPEPPKFGGKRMIERGMIPAVTAALLRRGWIRNAMEPVTA